jgi:RNA polymerase sigma factor (sigma-70 family)
MLKSAARYPLLTPLQEVELGRAIRAWQDHPDGPDQAPPRLQRAGKRALDRFVCSNIRLAHSLAKRYTDRGVPLEDLMQASIIGMIEAYRKFKPELGYRSSSYAIWYARQACQQLLAQMGQTLRLPVHTCDAMGRILKAARLFTEEHGRPPSQAELAASAGMTEAQLERLNELVANSRMVSIDDSPDGIGNSGLLGENRTMVPINGPSQERCALQRLHQSELAERLQRALEGHPEISDQQRFVLRQLYLESEPVNAVRLAYVLNMNRASILDMERQALEALRLDLGVDALDAVAA